MRSLSLSLILLASFTPYLYSQTLETNTQVGGPDQGESCSNVGTIPSPGATSVSSCAAGGTVVFDQVGDTRTWTGQAMAKANFGLLGTFASANASCQVSSGLGNCAAGGETAAVASFSDTISFPNAPPSGSLRVTMYIIGTSSLSCNEPTPTCGVVQTQLGVAGTPDGLNGERLFNVGTGVNFLNIPFLLPSTAGIVSVPLELNLISIVKCFNANTVSCGALSDFIHSASVTALTVLDANGNPVSGITLSAASGTNYNAINGSRFSAFAVKLEVTQTSFELNSTFSLGATSDGISPATENVSFQVGSFSGSIQAGLFKKTKSGFVYEGVIGGADIEMSITPLGGNRYAWKAEGSNVLVPGSPSPITIGLSIGNDTGTTAAQIRD
jgi:hypothetical protein